MRSKVIFCACVTVCQIRGGGSNAGVLFMTGIGAFFAKKMDFQINGWQVIIEQKTIFEA